MEQAKRRQLNNQGMSVAAVLFAIAFTGILVTTVIYVAFLNIQMQKANLEEKNVFYSAEQILDEIRAGLAVDMGNALSASYRYVLERYSVTEGLQSDTRRMQMFTEQYLENLRDDLSQSQIDRAHYSLEYLTSFVEKSNKTGNYEISSPTGAALLSSQEKGLTLAGVRVTFVNAKGRASVIETDLVLSIPEIHFTQSASMPDLMNLAVLADQKLIVQGQGEIQVNGSIYGGREGMTLEQGTFFSVSSGERVVTGAQIQLEEGSRLTVGEKTALWADNLLLNGQNARVSLLGKTYLLDDLTLNKNNKQVTISGEYYGFGNPKAVAYSSPANDEKAKGKDGKVPYEEKEAKDRSSAILVNGQSCTLDLTGLKKLLLAGNSYISVPSSSLYGKTGVSNGGDVLMGESITVKSNQLAYLVPAEAVGDGKNYENPMTAEQYESLLDWMEKNSAERIDLNRALEGLNGKSLGELGVTGSRLISYQTGDTPVFYLYLEFGEGEEAEKAAASYMESYYGLEKQKAYLEKYLRLYLSNEGIVRNSDFFSRYTTNGNLLVPKEEGSFFQKALDGRDSEDQEKKLIEEESGYVDCFYALNQKMISSYSSLSSEVKHNNEDGQAGDAYHNERSMDQTVFSNLIDEEAVKNYIKKYDTRTTGSQADGMCYFETKSGYRAYLIDTANENYQSRYGTNGSFSITSEFLHQTDSAGGQEKETRMIICLGDSRLLNGVSYTGILLCSGSVTLEGNSRIQTVAEETAKVFQCRYEDGAGEIEAPEGKCPMDFFWEGEEYVLNGVAAGTIKEVEKNSISLIELILYENWKKK